MYDTLILKLDKSSVPDTDFLEETSSYIDISNSGMYGSGIKWISGYLKGLRIHITDSSIKITGSIAKYYLGTNLETLNRDDVKKAIKDLSNRLHLPIDKALVTRIDVSENFIMKHSVNDYLTHLGQLSRFSRLEVTKGSLYYKQKEQELCFYDKVAEAKARRVEIPEIFKNKNVLRYEYRLIKRLSKRLNVREVNVSLLYDEGFYSKLIQLWAAKFLAINKINDMVINIEAMKTIKDLNSLGVIALIEKAGGEILFVEEIKKQQRQGTLTKKQAADLRKVVKRATKVKDNPLMVCSEDTKELDNKIKCTRRFKN